MELWAPIIRAQVYDFELLSRLAFTTLPAKGAVGASASVWHNDLDSSGAAPTGSYSRLVTMVRPSDATFKKQTKLVEAYAELRLDRVAEILAQVGTPNSFFGSIVFLDPVRSRWTTELLDAALGLASSVELRLKHSLACRRPLEYSPQIQPIIPTPKHGTLPSGHATEAFIFATVLIRLVEDAARTRKRIDFSPETKKLLMRQAERIAVNRTVAGVHFPLDSIAGATLGILLGHYMADRCMGNSNFNGGTFDGTNVDPKLNPDFHWTDVYSFENAGILSPGGDATGIVSNEAKPAALGKTKSPILEWLWAKARTEWQ
jgi:hypothetical protein